MKRLFLMALMGVFIAAATGNAQDDDERKFDTHLKKKARTPGNASVRVIVRFTSKPTLDDVDDLVRLGAKVRKVFKYFPGASVEIPEKLLKKLARHGKAVKVSADAALSLTHSDARRSSGASTSHSGGSGGSGIGIAVIDSGIAQMADLGNVRYSVDFTRNIAHGDERDEDEDENSGSGYDSYGHGTHVAGIIAGSGSSSKGKYGGLAPKAHLVNLRVLDSEGIGHTEDVMEAIEWVIDNRNKQNGNGKSLNIRVINLSLGHKPYETPDSDPLAWLCRLAVQNGIVVVAAAGNYGRSEDGSTIYGGITSPGIEPSVITVGAMKTWDTPSRSDDRVAAFSSRGPTVWGTIKPDFVAPGSAIAGPRSPRNGLSQKYPKINIDSNYMSLSGTSMAAAVASGAVALILEANPRLTPNAVKAILMYSAEKKSESPFEVGAGYLNIPGALSLASNIKTNVPVGQYWLRNNGVDVSYQNVIGNYPVVWSQTIVWETALCVGPVLAYNQPAWQPNVMWGAGSSWATSIVWQDDVSALTSEISGQTIVWEVAEALNVRWSGQTIVWDVLEALTIVWDIF